MPRSAPARLFPVDLNQSVHTMYNANPNYWREGLPIVDRYQNVVIKDIGSRFTALATGKIHYMGEGSWSMTPGQAQQAIRDFSDRVVINNQLNHWARTLYFGVDGAVERCPREERQSAWP